MRIIPFADELINADCIVSLWARQDRIILYLIDNRNLTERIDDTTKKSGYPSSVNVELRLDELKRQLSE